MLCLTGSAGKQRQACCHPVLRPGHAEGSIRSASRVSRCTLLRTLPERGAVPTARLENILVSQGEPQCCAQATLATTPCVPVLGILCSDRNQLPYMLSAGIPTNAAPFFNITNAAANGWLFGAPPQRPSDCALYLGQGSAALCRAQSRS